MAKSKHVLSSNLTPTPRKRAFPIMGAWHGHFANQWFEYPRNTRTDSDQIPSIWLRGHWITAAGFPIGHEVEMDVSPGVITLRLRTACPRSPP